MAEPAQLWNDDTLPLSEGVSATFESDESTITFDRTKANGTAQVNLLTKANANGKMELVAAGDVPAGQVDGSGGKGHVSVLLKQENRKIPRGDGTATVGQSVVGDTKSSAKGYGKGATYGSGRGYIWKVTTTDLYVLGW